jgi:hypothetical protein
MLDATGPKTFAIHLAAGTTGKSDAGLVAELVLGQTMRCVDPQYGEGGRFTDVTEIHTIPRDPDPLCLKAYGYEADVAGSGFSIRFSAMAYVFANGSIAFHMDFEDPGGWQQPESEELVGFTMLLVDQKIRLFFERRPRGGWMRTYGKWRHGEFFSCPDA